MMVGRIALVLLLSFGGCRHEPSDGGSDGQNATAESTDSVVSSAELDRLRSLGYLDYAPEPATEDEAGTVVLDEARSYPGYNLYTVRHRRIAELIDARGRVVNRWHQGTRGRWARSVLLPDGDLIVVGAELPERFVLRLTWDNEVVWKRTLPAHHDIAPAPDNRFMLLTSKRRSAPEFDAEFDIRDDVITMISHEGNLLEERSLYDMMLSRPDLLAYLKITPREGVIDLFHANSVRWMTHKHLVAKHPIYAPTNVIVCIRNRDLVAIFNWDEQALVWAWGQGEISGPHDAAVLKNGNILLFDNGLSRGSSRVIELDPLTRQIVWQYNAPDPPDFFTESRGANQRLPNGNTLITESDSGRAFEVTREGEIVWEYLVPYANDKGHRATIIRLYRYEQDFVDGIVAKVAPASRGSD